jgi:hypothetical protein
MSLLEELQSEVRRIRAQEIQQDAELAAQQEFYEIQLRPVMLRAYEYFAQIVENLNIVAPDIRASYPLNPLLQHGVSLNQSQYKFRADHKDNPHQIDIFCKCVLEKPHEFYLSSPKAIQRQVELLDNYNFPYHRKNRLDRHHNIQGAIIILEGPMMVHIRIAASPADRSVHIGLRNVEMQPVKRHKFSPDAVDDELLERIAKVLIRKEPVLVERSVDTRFRDQLRDQIARDKYETEQDIAQVYSEREAEKTALKNARLIYRAQRSVAERMREILQYFSKN